MIKTGATITLQHDTPVSPFRASEFDTALEWAEKEILDSVEIAILDPNSVDVHELQKKLKHHKLNVCTISTGQALGIDGFCLSDSDSVKAKKAVDRIKSHIRLAEKILCPFVTVGLIRGTGKTGGLDVLKSTMSDCRDYAKSKNIEIIVEPINRYETSMMNSCDQTCDFIEKIGWDGIGVLFDTFHSNIEDKSITDAIKSLGNHLLHVHFADSNRYLPGQGHIDFDAIYSALNSIDYNGYIVIETLNLPNRQAIISGAAQALRKIMN